jgi:hypothetical protein
MGSGRHLSNDMQVFEYFGKLPAEIRLKIWGECMERRVTRVKPCENGLFRLDSRLLTPLLHVCRESRTLALFHYTEFLRYNTRKNLGGAYISYAHDSIFLQRDNCVTTVESELACLELDLDKIQSLVVDMKFIQH